MTTIEDRLNGPGAQPWIPDPANAKKWLDGGDDRTCYQENPIIGTAVDHYTRETDYGPYDVLVLNVEGVGDVAVHCRGTVLQNEMRATRPAYGEKVGVKLTGEGEGTRGKYPIYKVVVEREAGGEFTWLGADPAPSGSRPSREEQRGQAPAPAEDDDIPF